jgi:ankyrin repeat protein
MNHAPHSDHPEAFDRSTYPECLKLILGHGVSVNVRGKKGETLMHAIIAAGRIWGQEVMTDAERMQFAVIALEASPDLTVRDDLLKSTVLGWACRWGRKELVRLLLEHNAAVLEPDAEGWATPLAWAEKMGHTSITALLREYTQGELQSS